MNSKDPKTKFIAFGDSFIKMFSTLAGKSFKICKYKGAPIKGIVNRNENYKNILERLKTPYDYGFFGFGQVDFFFYYYKKKYIDGDNQILDKMYEYAETYVKLISELKNIKNKIIFGVLPSHIANHNYKKFLMIYGVFTEENINLLADEYDYDYTIRNLRIIHFNELLEKYCKIYGVIFCNVYNNLVDANGNMYEILLLKHNTLNVHINYEMLLFVYLKKCLNFLLKYYGLEKIYTSAERNYNKYIGSKNLGPNYNFDMKGAIEYINKI